MNELEDVFSRTRGIGAVTRLLRIEITNENKTLLIINVFLPYNATENVNDYFNRMGNLEAIFLNHDNLCVYIVGDLKADPSALAKLKKKCSTTL